MLKIKVTSDNFSSSLGEEYVTKVQDGGLDINANLPELVVLFKKLLLGWGFHHDLVERIYLMPFEEKEINEDFDSIN